MTTTKQLGWQCCSLALASVLAVGLAAGLPPRRAHAAAICVGDCDGNGEVTVNEIVVLVNIVLGVGAPSACPDGIPPGVDVDVTLVIQAVANDLTNCPSQPTVTATATATVRPTPINTPMGGCSSANPLNVAGTYNFSVGGIDSSTCPSELTDAIEEQLTQIQPGTETVTQQGAVVALESDLSGCVDDQGNVTAAFEPESATQNGCTVTITGSLTVHLKNNPSHGGLTAVVNVSSGCHAGFSRCMVVVGIDVDKIGPAQARRAGANEIISATAAAVVEAVVNVRR